MKKKQYLLILLFLFLFGCSKKIVTLDEFVKIAEFNGYIIKEDKTGYNSYDKILNVYYAINRENAYDIQFLELNNEDYAHDFFLLNKEDIKENITSSDYQKNKSSSHNELYHAENSAKYLLVIRTGSNIIYIDAPIGYINEIEEFLSELGLDY